MGILPQEILFWYGTSKHISRIEQIERGRHWIWGTLDSSRRTRFPFAGRYIRWGKCFCNQAQSALLWSPFPYLLLCLNLPCCHFLPQDWLISREWRQRACGDGRGVAVKITCWEAVVGHLGSMNSFCKGLLVWWTLWWHFLVVMSEFAECETSSAALGSAKCVRFDNTHNSNVVCRQPSSSEDGEALQKIGTVSSTCAFENELEQDGQLVVSES